MLILIISKAGSADTIKLNDGLLHVLNDNSYQQDTIYLDLENASSPGTRVDLIEGGKAEVIIGRGNSNIFLNGGDVGRTLQSYENSSILVNKGTVGDHLSAFDDSSIIVNDILLDGGFLAADNATATINGGHMIGLQSASCSNVTINGGTFDLDVYVNQNGNVTVTGGSIGRYLDVSNDGIIYLDGTGFELDGQTLSYGDKLSDFAELVVPIYGSPYYTGIITGTLSDKSNLNNQFYIYNTGSFEGIADIVIIPEPATITFLGLSYLMLRKRKIAVNR